MKSINQQQRKRGVFIQRIDRKYLIIIKMKRIERFVIIIKALNEEREKTSSSTQKKVFFPLFSQSSRWNCNSSVLSQYVIWNSFFRLNYSFLLISLLMESSLFPKNFLNQVNTLFTKTAMVKPIDPGLGTGTPMAYKIPKIAPIPPAKRSVKKKKGWDDY